jgi:ATP-dependent RNA helicase DOB1
VTHQVFLFANFPIAMDQDLFSFLDGDAGQDEEMHAEPAEATSAPSKPRKRKANSPQPVPNGGQKATTQNDNEPGPSSPKRPRVDAPNPVVLDDFETEAKREVAASAGLTGSSVESGTRLELRHQVRAKILRSYRAVAYCVPGPPPSRCPGRLQLHPDFPTCSPSKT